MIPSNKLNNLKSLKELFSFEYFPNILSESREDLWSPRFWSFSDAWFIWGKKHTTGNRNSRHWFYDIILLSVSIICLIWNRKIKILKLSLQVTLCIYSLARTTQKHPEYNGPAMGPKMATENKRNFTEEDNRKMRDGQIGLQVNLIFTLQFIWLIFEILLPYYQSIYPFI